MRNGRPFRLDHADRGERTRTTGGTVLCVGLFNLVVDLRRQV
jgi:hypothetical protein